MIDEVFEQADLSTASLNIREVRANLSRLIEGLEGDTPVVVAVRNKPTAVILDLTAYRQMREEAFAFRLMQIAEEAEHKPKETIEEFEAALDAAAERRRARRAALQAAEAEAA